jgi:hypothetical protein
VLRSVLQRRLGVVHIPSSHSSTPSHFSHCCSHTPSHIFNLQRRAEERAAKEAKEAEEKARRKEEEETAKRKREEAKEVRGHVCVVAWWYRDRWAWWWCYHALFWQVHPFGRAQEQVWAAAADSSRIT